MMCRFLKKPGIQNGEFRLICFLKMAQCHPRSCWVKTLRMQ